MPKTLWMFEFWEGKSVRLVALYAVDRSDAAVQARDWAAVHGLKLTSEPHLTNYTRGFVIAYSSLPGTIEEERCNPNSTNT